MNLLRKTASIIAITIFGFNCSNAQEVKSATTFSGNADFYYRFNFANNENQNNNLTSFTNSQDSFELGMATIKATHKLGKASVVADLGFGTRAKEFTYNDNNNQFMIKQLNMTYEFSDKFKVTAGAFATHLGYELVDATDNKNYSMSYAFTNGPFFNTGIKAQYTAGKFSIMAGLSNPTDFKTASQAGSKQKTVIGQIGYTEDNGSLFLNFTSGSNNPASINNKTQFDIVGSRKFNDKLTLGFNGTYAIQSNDHHSDDKKWFSAIGYAHIAVAKSTTLNYRLEYFSDKDGLITTLDNTILANTLSLQVKEGNFTFIPEIRFDSASKDIFYGKNDLTASTKSAGSILLATTYSF